MREEFGLKRDALSLLVAGLTKSSQGWALEPKPRMPPGPRWTFPNPAQRPRFLAHSSCPAKGVYFAPRSHFWGLNG
jgi:hypothetical protein